MKELPLITNSSQTHPKNREGNTSELILSVLHPDTKRKNITRNDNYRKISLINIEENPPQSRSKPETYKMDYDQVKFIPEIQSCLTSQNQCNTPY